MQRAGVALPPLDYEFDGFDAVDAAYDAACPPFDETRRPTCRGALNLGRHIFYCRAPFPGSVSAGDRLPHLSEYFAWRLGGADGFGATSLGAHTDLWRPKRGGLSSMVDRLGWRLLFPPMRKAWETAREAQARGRGGDRPCAERPDRLRRARFERLPRAASHVAARQSRSPDLDRNLGHHHGGRRQGAARSQGGHAGQCRCARGSGPDRAIYGRTRVRGAGGRRRPPRRARPTWRRSSPPARWPFPPFPTRAARSPAAKGRVEGRRPRRAAARTALATLYTALMTAHLVERLEAPGTSSSKAASTGRRPSPRRSPPSPRPAGRRRPEERRRGGGAALLAHWGEPVEPPAREAAQTWGVPGLQAYRERWEQRL